MDHTTLQVMVVSKHQHWFETFYSFQQAHVLDTAVVSKNQSVRTMRMWPAHAHGEEGEAQLCCR